jgi:hypothetical protein
MAELTKDGYAVFINDDLIAVFSEKDDAEYYMKNTIYKSLKPTILHVFFGVEAF